MTTRPSHHSRSWYGFLAGLYFFVVLVLLAATIRVVCFPIPGEFDHYATPWWALPVSMLLLAVYGLWGSVQWYHRWRAG